VFHQRTKLSFTMIVLLLILVALIGVVACDSPRRET